MTGPEDYGARLRASRCYADIALGDLADALGVSISTLTRIEKNERPLTLPEARKAADTCGVPLLFLLEGFRLYEEAERQIIEPATRRAAQPPRAPSDVLAPVREVRPRSPVDRRRKPPPPVGETRRGGAG